MLTVDLIQQALATLERGELPDHRARVTLCASVRRTLSGLSWSAATGASGSLRVRERNTALRAIAAALADGDCSSAWAISGRVHEALRRPLRMRGRPALLEALQDAHRRGAAELSRDSIYRLLKAGISPGADSSLDLAD